MDKVEDFNNMLERAFADCQGDSAFRMDRERPYNGQIHTDNGDRGKTIIEGLTMRDMTDCIVRGFLDAGGLQSENPLHDDIYKIEEDLDYGAVIQNTMCWVEKYMSIFPNIPKLREQKKT